MPGTKPLPRHGTVHRYRLELKAQRAGTGGPPCDRCKQANAAARRKTRSDARARAARASMHIVEDTQNEDTDKDTPLAPPPPPEPGLTELGLLEDLKEIPPDQQAPMHRTLTGLARQFAREVDAPDTPSAQRSAARRNLLEVVKALLSRKEGDGGGALEAALFDFGTPLVPGNADTEVRTQEKS